MTSASVSRWPATRSTTLEGVLVDPNDETQAIDSNLYSAGPVHPRCAGAGHAADHGQPGPGSVAGLIINVVNPVPGTAFDQAFTGTIGFNQSQVKAKGLPNSTGIKLAAGSSIDRPGRRDQHRHRADQRPGRPAVPPSCRTSSWSRRSGRRRSSCPHTGRRPTWFRRTPPADVTAVSSVAGDRRAAPVPRASRGR